MNSQPPCNHARRTFAREEIEPFLVALLGLLIGVALTIKLTVAIEAAAMFGFLLIALKRPRQAIAASTIALGVVDRPLCVVDARGLFVKRTVAISPKPQCG